uniref:C2H2-type domain-containing protein n=1 Tax=Angiostrongylus cantonensis TaxID=6313 RepID=A0A158P5U0_ANGCA
MNCIFAHTSAASAAAVAAVVVAAAAGYICVLLIYGQASARAFRNQVTNVAAEVINILNDLTNDSIDELKMTRKVRQRQRWRVSSPPSSSAEAAADVPSMSSDFGVHQLLTSFDGSQPGPSRVMIRRQTHLQLVATDQIYFDYLLNESTSLSASFLWSEAIQNRHVYLSLLSAFLIEHSSRNSSKTLKCPKCNWHYKYQETLEIHMKEKHSDGEVKCGYCAENRVHPKLARGESYSCGYKPYRLYSTTTKGNLSIHMQSDKHLHAVQELPSGIASLSCPPTRSPPSDDDHSLVCVVCGCFSSDDLEEMIAHADKSSLQDRSSPSHGDISMSSGVFRCHLCPYHTNLKANFQLHTRTDKHLQRVQMVCQQLVSN